MVGFFCSKSRDVYLTYCCLLLVFCVCPVLGVSLTIFVALNNKSISKEYIYFLFLLLAIYMGCINSTKIPESDQYMFYDAYRLVPHRTFLQNLMGIYGSFQDYQTKEMGFGLFNFVGYYLTAGCYPLFVLLGSILLYMLYYDAIYRYYHYVKVGNPNVYALAGAIILTFFTQFFNLTIHLERQYLATAFVIYALIRTITQNKVSWVYILIGLSMHTSLGIFLPLFLLRQFKKDLSLKWMIIVIGILLIVMFSLNYILGSILTGGDSYVMDRLQDMGDEGNEDRMSLSLIIVVALPMILISVKNILWNYKLFVKDEILLYLTYLFILIFALSNPNNTMQYRYFMMTYSFIPFIFPMFWRKYSVYTKLYLSVLCFFLVMRFYMTFDDIPFRFAPCSDVLSMNLFSLFNYNNI